MAKSGKGSFMLAVVCDNDHLFENIKAKKNPAFLFTYE